MMKKLTSVLTTMLLVVSMVITGVVPVFATSIDVDPSRKGSISLTKYDIATVTTDKDGNITGGTPVAGATFSAYHILDFDGKTYTVNSNFTNQVDVSDIVNTSAKQAGTLSYGSTNKLEAQISKLQNYIKTKPVTATASKVTDSNGALTIDNLELGVYLVQETNVPQGYTVSTQAFLVAIPTWNQEANDGAGEWVYEVQAKPKDELLQVDKEIKDGENSTDADSYSVGDNIPYTVTAKIPNYGMSADYPNLTVTENLLLHYPETNGITSIDKYNALNLTFTDTMTKGLTLNLNSLKVEVLNADGTVKTTLTKGNTLAELESFTTTGTDDAERVATKTTVAGGADYTATETKGTDDSTTMTVTVAWNSVDPYQGDKIRLTYTAQLNDDAVIKDPNKNTVTYAFANDPQSATGEPDDPTKTTTTDETEVYTYQMELTKTFNDKNQPESGKASAVEFELYVQGETTPLNVIKVADGQYTIWTGAVEKDANGTLQAVDIVNDQAGVAQKTYVGAVATALHPDDNGKLTVKGFKAGTYELKETKSVQGYTLLASPLTIQVEEVTDASTGAVTGSVTAYTVNSDGKKDELAQNAESGIFQLTVNNAKNQFNLPQTGGRGLWMFTIGGGILMAGAIIIFSVLHKKKSKKS